MRVALVHDQLQEFGGAERVLVAFKAMYPDADVFTSFYSPDTLGIHAHLFTDWNIQTAWCSHVPLLNRLYSPFRFITPWIWESLDFSNYDLVISSSGSYMCKGIITKPETTHICYIHHPPRYLYYYETALEWQKYWPIRVYGHFINHDLRIWDYLSSQRVDYFMANSQETRSRVQKLYRMDASVMYCPVDIPQFTTTDIKEMVKKRLDKDGYYVTVSRLARAKHIDILIKAANEAKFNLKIIGKGRDEEYLKGISGPTISFYHSISDTDFRGMYEGAKAFLFASVDEEFGIAPVEAMGHGVPVIAYASGGLKETVVDGKSGFLYHSLDKAAVLEGINRIEKMSNQEYEAICISSRERSEKFTFDMFKERVSTFINDKINHF